MLLLGNLLKINENGTIVINEWQNSDEFKKLELVIAAGKKLSSMKGTRVVFKEIKSTEEGEIEKVEDERFNFVLENLVVLNNGEIKVMLSPRDTKAHSLIFSAELVGFQISDDPEIYFAEGSTDLSLLETKFEFNKALSPEERSTNGIFEFVLI